MLNCSGFGVTPFASGPLLASSLRGMEGRNGGMSECRGGGTGGAYLREYTPMSKCSEHLSNHNHSI